MEDKIKSFKEVCEICHGLQKEGKKIVFVHGCFDILHVGHIALLKEARNLGDILVVGINPDFDVRFQKGRVRPFHKCNERLFCLSNLESMSYVFAMPSFSNLKEISEEIIGSHYDEIYSILNPDLVVSSSKADPILWKQNRAKKLGIAFSNIDHGFYNVSTTKIAKALGLE